MNAGSTKICDTIYRYILYYNGAVNTMFGLKKVIVCIFIAMNIFICEFPDKK